MTRGVLGVASLVFFDAVKRKVVLAVGFLALVLAVAIPSLPSYGLGVVEAYYREVALALTFAVGLVLTLALSANRIPGEVERRVVYPLLSRSMRRWEYVLGTWLGVFAVMGVMIAFFTLTEQAVAVVAYRDPMFRLWQGSFAIWLEMGVVSGLAVAVSTAAGAVVVTTATLMFLFVAHSKGAVEASLKGSPLLALYPTLEPFDVINAVAHGTGVAPARYLPMLTSFAGWCLLLVIAGSLAFSRRDL